MESIKNYDEEIEKQYHPENFQELQDDIKENNLIYCPLTHEWQDKDDCDPCEMCD